MARALGELERLIMDRMWSWDHPVAVREVLEDLQRERPLAYTTVMTVMDNLHRKEILSREKRGRAFLYRPAVSREEHTAAFMGDVLADTPDKAATILQFVEQMPEDEAARLRAALEEHFQNREAEAS